MQAVKEFKSATAAKNFRDKWRGKGAGYFAFDYPVHHFSKVDSKGNRKILSKVFRVQYGKA